MASAYLFAMLAVTPSESREVALIANPEFEAGRVAGHRARRLIGGENPAFSDPSLLMAHIVSTWALICPRPNTLVTPDEIDDPNSLQIKLWVNDELRQDFNSRYYIYVV